MDCFHRIITHMNIKTFDLNLLKSFDALLEECSVSRAAARVHLSQPAMSNALARLRDALDDPVLVRTPQGMEPTARALALKGPVRQALLQIETALGAQPEFDPRTARRSFVVAATDYMEFLVLPRLMRVLQTEAPGIDIRVRSLQLKAPEEPLDSGDVDLAFGFFADVPKRLNRRHLFTETMTCLVRADHPVLYQSWNLERFVEMSHLFVATRQGSAGVVDNMLTEKGLQRRIALVVPHFLVVPYIIAETDLIVTVNSRIADTYVRELPLKSLPPPLDLPEFPITMLWHPRSDGDPSIAWLRRMLIDICNDIDHAVQAGRAR
ncbi:MAG: LysR family transcriptional regulator [Betaproteobacteria bacterium]|nr:LysR family transcriptional regulator [Betaproteobacteria bacterium]